MGRAQGLPLHRCRSCGLVRFEAIAPPDTVYQAGYHDGANEYGWHSTDATRREYERLLGHRRFEWIEAHRDPGSMVDIGGGAGHVVAAAADRGWHATLVEPVESTVEFATKELGIRAVCGGIDDVVESGEQYDLISLIHVLEHFPDPATRLEALAPRLADGGMLFVEVPNYRSAARRGLGDGWMGWRGGEHVHFFTRRTLAGTLRRAGYELVAARTMVPSWDGLGPGANAHFLGIERLLNRVIDRRHDRLRRQAEPAQQTDPAEDGWQPEPPKPVRDATGVRRAVYGHGFSTLHGLQEATGFGSNLLALARPAS